MRRLNKNKLQGLARSTKGCCLLFEVKMFDQILQRILQAQGCRIYKEEVTLKNNLKIAQSEFEEKNHDNEQ